MTTSKATDNTGYKEAYRDHLGNVTQEGKRLKIHPQRPVGRHHSVRRIVSWVLLAILFTGPFVEIGGHPLLLLNILERKFVLFGVPFWPQDLHLFLLAVLSLVVFIVLFTAVFGRIWCGWVCPQTIFMEMIFRKIEYWIEGDAAMQRRLDREPWTQVKILKKMLKHGVFFAISFLIANTFLAYISGSGPLWQIITDPPSEHLQGLFSISIFSLVFYGVFARFREQACIIVCPYGRWQSAMVNEDTIAVTYDYRRGEPRAKLKRAEHETEGTGDCIDCGQCVQVCPTGIDIRNGIQLECVNCTACIDACDAIMDKVERPRGLIRYSSYRGIEENRRKLLTPRVLAYAAVLAVLLGVVTYLFATRDQLQAVILREPGKLHTNLADGRLANFYSVKIINKTFAEVPVEIRVVEPAAAEIISLGDLAQVPPQGMLVGRFLLALPREGLMPGRNPVGFAIYADGRFVSAVESAFLAPHNVQKKGS
ncbi:MAG: cytochrome c oxidase accessory protein CcoG [Gemmatimonadetes bacterium]|nr:cytochrome c oxidase accessory protein CcoG [Gemmatimonadota bacterium]